MWGQRHAACAVFCLRAVAFVCLQWTCMCACINLWRGSVSSSCKPSICVFWFCGLCICVLLHKHACCIIDSYLHSVVTKGGNLLESLNRCVVTVHRAGMSGFVSGNQGSRFRLWVKLVLFELTRVGGKFHPVRKCKWWSALMTVIKDCSMKCVTLCLQSRFYSLLLFHKMN